MNKTSFANWELSSSDEEPITKGRLLSVKNTKRKHEHSPKSKDDIIDLDEYVPLADRVKRRQIADKGIVVDDDDDDSLPVFTLPSQSIHKHKETEASIDLSDKLSSSSSNAPQVVVSDDENPVAVPSKVRKAAQDRSNDNSAKSNLNAQLKALKPEECLKYIECSISSKLQDLFENFNILDNLKKDFVPSCILTPNEIPCVQWRRTVPSVIDSKSQNDGCEEEKDILVVIPAANFLKMINSSVVDTNCEETLPSWVEALQTMWKDSKIHLVCVGLEKYKKSLKAKKARQDKNGKTSSRKRKSTVPDVSPWDVETASIELHVDFNITITYVETPEELVTLIKQTTKSVGEAPYKTMKRQDVQFINEIPSVKIDPKTGEGKRQAWKQMIQQFHNVTTVMATAITDRYPSILSLMKAYEECGTDFDKAEMLLSEIPVRRGVGNLQTSRRIGPELSCRIYKQLTSTDPNKILY